MATKFSLFTIIFAISISVNYARGPDKIINGQLAFMRDAPHQVSLHIGNIFCGGSIIGPQLILTAAHCIADHNGNPITNKNNMFVLIGTYDSMVDVGVNKFRVVRGVRHNFNLANSNRNDIAILKLHRPIRFNGLARSAKLPLEDVRAGTRVMASGWGATLYDFYTKKGINKSQYLQKYYGVVISQNQCKQLLPLSKIGPEHVCVIPLNGASVCNGDSGGPLTYSGNVIGIASFNYGCGQNLTDVYTNVHHYLPWIQTVEKAMVENSKLPSSPEFVEF